MTEIDPQGNAELALDIDMDGGGLTLNEIIEVEDLSGETVHDRSGRFLRAVAWVNGRRQNPDLTIEDAGELVVKIERSDG